MKKLRTLLLLTFFALLCTNVVADDNDPIITITPASKYKDNKLINVVPQGSDNSLFKRKVPRKNERGVSMNKVMNQHRSINPNNIPVIKPDGTRYEQQPQPKPRRYYKKPRKVVAKPKAEPKKVEEPDLIAQKMAEINTPKEILPPKDVQATVIHNLDAPVNIPVNNPTPIIKKTEVKKPAVKPTPIKTVEKKKVSVVKESSKPLSTTDKLLIFISVVFSINSVFFFFYLRRNKNNSAQTPDKKDKKEKRMRGIIGKVAKGEVEWRE